MKKFEKIWPRFWQVVVWGVCFGLFVVGLVAVLVRVSEYDEAVALVPGGVNFLLEVKAGEVPIEWLEGVWGEQGARMAEEGGKVVGLPSGGVVFAYFGMGNEMAFETGDYKGYYLENLRTGENYWRTFRGGWVFEGREDELKELVDMWGEGESLQKNAVWAELKDNLAVGGARLFVFGVGKEVPELWRGMGVVWTGEGVEALTLLERGKVMLGGFGQSREKFKGELFGVVPEGVCYSVGGENLGEQWGWVSEVLGEQAPEVLGWWKGMMMQGGVEEVWAEQGEVVIFDGEVVTESKIWEDGGSEVREDFKKMTSGNARWAALIYPKNCEWELGYVGGFGKVFLEQQVYDDRILTSAKFE